MSHSQANLYRLARTVRGFAGRGVRARAESGPAFYSPTVSSPAPAAQPAATVVLLRDAARPGPGGARVQVFLQRRVAGMTVFPGGSVDTGDRPDPALWRGPDAQWLSLIHI